MKLPSLSPRLGRYMKSGVLRFKKKIFSKHMYGEVLNFVE
jgi:hypothetical protein